MTSPNPTPASEWGRDDEVVELPSGKTARLRRRLNSFALLRSGALSPELVKLYAKAETGKLDPEKDDLQMVLRLNDVLVKEMFVEPTIFIPVADEQPADGEVHVDALGDDDIQFVLERAFGGTPEVASFRGEPGGDGPGGGGEVLGEEPGGDGGAPGGDVPRVPARRKAGAQAGRKRNGGR